MTRSVILVCEDHPALRQAMERQLVLLGHSAVVHETGAGGLRLWREGRIDLVVTDLQMPELDGIGLTRAIRAAERDDPSLSRTPVIVMSGAATVELRAECAAAGADSLLAKPASMRDLDAAIRALLQGALDAPAVDPVPCMPITTQSSTAAPIDRGTLAACLGDDLTSIRQAVDEFLSADAADHRELAAAIAAADSDRVKRIAHRIDGACRVLGARAYSHAAADLHEAFAGSANDERRREVAATLDRERARLTEALQTEFGMDRSLDR